MSIDSWAQAMTYASPPYADKVTEDALHNLPKALLLKIQSAIHTEAMGKSRDGRTEAALDALHNVLCHIAEAERGRYFTGRP